MYRTSNYGGRGLSVFNILLCRVEEPAVVKVVAVVVVKPVLRVFEVRSVIMRLNKTKKGKLKKETKEVIKLLLWK